MNKIIHNKIKTRKNVILPLFLFTLTLLFPNYVSASYYENNTTPVRTIVMQKNITINMQNKPIRAILQEIYNKSSISFAISENIEKELTNLSINVNNMPIGDALTVMLKGTGYLYVIKNNLITIEKSPVLALVPQKQEEKIVSGKIVNKDTKLPISGATIIIKGSSNGAITDENGAFKFKVDIGDVIQISYVGMLVKEVVISESNLKDIIIALVPDNIAVEDVVVTGIFTRKSESYTGSSTTLTAKDLKRVGNQNIFQSLRNLDPSLYIMDDISQGSNPNALPDMKMRGTSSFQDTETSSLKGNYGSKPNQPLFILDGFETTAERVFDLDMNRVESITLLKDASAKAIYGSKAANGVVVIETQRIKGDKPRVTYVGSVDITMPDLTSYDLCNSFEKLEVERIEGVYTHNTNDDEQIKLWNLYNSRIKSSKEGLDTYWLSKPLQVGVGTKHSLSIEVGDSNSVKGIVDFSYNNVDGVMKGSGRTNINGSVNLSYRIKNLSFRNIMSIVSNNSQNSPYGNFQDYTELNPYWRAEDENGKVLQWADYEDKVSNPMYDAELGTLSKESYLDFTNNLYVEWNINNDFKLIGRLGIAMKRSDSDDFKPAQHSDFLSGVFVATSEDIIRRGSYELQNGKSSNLSADINLNYNKTLGEDHNLFANIGAKMSDSNSKSFKHLAEGFPGNMGADVTFARSYALNGRPVSYSTLVRDVSLLAFASYSYKNKYLFDATYRANASSLYGVDNRWSSGWSIGTGYNIHKENFLKNSDVISQLKVRGSVGVTGNQNFNVNQTITTYQYYTDVNYQGLVGAYMSGLANPSLSWEQRKDYSVGLDAQIKGTTIRFDYFNGVTENMVADISVPTSTGFEMVKDNLGKVRNRGFELYIGTTIVQNEDGFFNLFASGTTTKNTIIELSDAMSEYNRKQEEIAANLDNGRPVLMYKDGVSMDAIWAVPSLGIDPMSGDEVFIDQNGEVTYKYDPRDMICAGDSEPKFRGNIGFTAEYKGVGLSLSCRYLAGGDMYNQTLVDRVENVDVSVNVDRRVLLGRWQEVGQETEFRRLDSDGFTSPTTRFIQKRNEFDIGSINLYYEFDRELIKKAKLQRLKIAFYMNDVVKFSSIKIERGLSYPFARTMSFSLTATF